MFRLLPSSQTFFARRSFQVYNSRSRLDQLTPQIMTYGLIGANIVVYGCWQYADMRFQQFRDVSAYRFLSRHFAASYRNISELRPWTLLTACFSHQSFFHLGVNMFLLYSLGPAMASAISPRSFLKLYMLSGVAGSVTSVAFQRIQRTPSSPFPIRQETKSIGASGALMGTLMTYALLYPSSTVLLFFVIPVPILYGVLGYAAYDTYQMLSRHRSSSVDHAGHVGGLICGAFYYYYWMRRGRFGGANRYLRW